MAHKVSELPRLGEKQIPDGVRTPEEQRQSKRGLPDRVSDDLCKMREHFESMLPLIQELVQISQTNNLVLNRVADRFEAATNKLILHNDALLEKATENTTAIVEAVKRLTETRG